MLYHNQRVHCQFLSLPPQSNICRQGQEPTPRERSHKWPQTPGLPTNIRLRLKWLTVSNTLAYCDAESFTAVKSLKRSPALGLYLKTLRIHNVRKIDRLHSKVLSVTFTGVTKHTSLLRNPYITTPQCFIEQALGRHGERLTLL